MDIQPVVGIIMGSQSDWPTMRRAADALGELGIAYEKRIVSAHRTPERLYTYAKEAEGRGLKVIIAGAGGAAHLPGMAASLTCLPVLGVPIKSRALSGLDSLLSIVQMPSGIPVATLAIGDSGAYNAGLMAAQILALADPALASRLREWRQAHTSTVAEEPSRCRPLNALPRGSVIGIVGGGQLGRMLAQAAAKLGFKASIFSPETDSPAFDVAAFRHCAAYDDAEALGQIRRQADVVTFEFENIPSDALAIIERRCPVSPPRRALEVSQNRIAERRFLASLGLPVAPWAEIANRRGTRARLHRAFRRGGARRGRLSQASLAGLRWKGPDAHGGHGGPSSRRKTGWRA